MQGALQNSREALIFETMEHPQHAILLDNLRLPFEGDKKIHNTDVLST